MSGGASVVNEVESDRLFGFIAPATSMSVFDEEGLYRPGGSDEITRGRIVRILAGEPTEVVVFTGFTDREVTFSFKDSILNLNVIGFGALLQDVKLGRVFDGYNQELSSRYRYIKQMTDTLWDSSGQPLKDEDGQTIQGDVEYVAWPSLYETIWQDHPEMKIGFKKVFRFDTLVGIGDVGGNRIPFCSEYQPGSAYVEVAGADPDRRWPWNLEKLGLFKRMMSPDNLMPIRISDIVNFLKLQVDETLSGFGVVFDPGSIGGEFIKAQVTQFVIQDAILFLSETNGEVLPALIGWLKDEPNTAAIGRIYNEVDYVQDATFSFPTRDDALNAFPEPRHPWAIMDAPNPLRSRNGIFHYEADGVVIAYRTLNWQQSVQNKSADGLTIWYEIFEAWITDWYKVNYRTGDINHYRVSGLNHLGNTVNDYKKASDIPALSHVSVKIEPAHTEANKPTEYSGSDPSFRIDNLKFGERTYELVNGVLFVLGELAISSLQFRFDDANAYRVMSELAKLTNSIFFTDNDKQIHLVRRDYYADSHSIIEDTILGLTLTIHDYWGEPLPEISSSIVRNEDYLKALADFYEENYLNKVDEVWTIRCLATTENCQVQLLDKISFVSGEIEAGFDDTKPLIVRRIALDQDSITFTAVKNR